MLCVVCGIIESDCSLKKKKVMKPPRAFFVHCSTCMSRQLSLPMNVADALWQKGKKKDVFVFSIGLSCLVFVLDWHVSHVARFLSNLFPNGYLLSAILTKYISLHEHCTLLLHSACSNKTVKLKMMQNEWFIIQKVKSSVSWENYSKYWKKTSWLF